MRQARTSFHLPLDGEWVVTNGGIGQDKNVHDSPDQLYAYDFIRRGGTGPDPSGYPAYGEPVVAPADGRVVVAVDGHPDLRVGDGDEAHPAGNHVVIDHGTGEYSWLAHLKQGSVSAQPGMTVRRGERVGACGNSGNSSEPHVHFHVQDSPRPSDGRAILAPLRDILVNGQRRERWLPERGDRVAQAGRAASPN